MQRLNVRTALLGLVALALVGCADAPEEGATAPAEGPFFSLRLVHAVPDAPDVDVLYNGNTYARDLGFKEATSLSRVRDLGTVSSVQVDAQTPGGPATVIGPVDIDFEEDTSYNILAVGTVATIEPLIISNPTSSVPAGTVRAQVVHGAPSAPPVDVFVTAPGADLTQSVPLGSFAFKEDLGPVDIPEGDYQIRVTLPGDPGTVVFDSGTVALPSSDLLIVAVDNTGPGTAPISLLVADNGLGSFEILDQATPTQFRVIHA